MVPQAQQPRGGPKDDTNSAATARRAEGRHGGGRHQREGPNHRTAGPTTTRTAKRQAEGRHSGGQHQREGPNHRTAGPTTTRTAQRQHEGPNDDTVGVNANAKGQTTVPQAQRQHGRLNAELGSPGRGFGAEPRSAPFFLCIVFYLVHVPRHQGGSTPSLKNKYIFFLVSFLWVLRYILNIVGDRVI